MKNNKGHKVLVTGVAAILAATPDRTGVRDYIYVMDLAEGHVHVRGNLLEGSGAECSVWNLGTGNGYSVLQVISAFEAASARAVPYQIAGRRPGDIAICWADPSKASSELSWTATRSLEQMMIDSWRWQVGNPVGYI